MNLSRATTAAIGLLGIYLFLRGAYEASALGVGLVLSYTTEAAEATPETAIAIYMLVAAVVLSAVPGIMLILFRESIARRFVMPQAASGPDQGDGSLSVVAFAIFGMYFLAQGFVSLVRYSAMMASNGTFHAHGVIAAAVSSIVLGGVVVRLSPSFARFFAD